MRRLIALAALAGLLASPAVAQTRLFCRYTGAEIFDCPERGAPPVRELRESGCCVRRVSVPLASSTGAAAAPDLAPPAAPALPVVAAPALLTCFAPQSQALAGAGPPLFVQHRAWLI